MDAVAYEVGLREGRRDERAAVEIPAAWRSDLGGGVAEGSDEDLP